MEPLIRLTEIVKDYGAFRALDHVSVDFGGGITGLLGPNGAGKSTLIKILFGMLRPTRGTGQVLGLDMARQSRKIRARVGYLPEDDCYIAGLTGIESVRFTARLSGLASREALRRAHEMLDYCGVEQERYRLVETYSTGMRQKLKFAQAIVHDPDLLILDEPSSGLDPQEREIMLRRIRTLAERSGKAVLISTHILRDVQTICDHVVILAGGRLRISERLDVLSRPQEPAYQLRVVGNPQRFVELARAAGHDVYEHHDGMLTVRGIDESSVEQLWRWSRQSRSGLRSLRPSRNTAEQIFIDAIRSEGRADS